MKKAIVLMLSTLACAISAEAAMPSSNPLPDRNQPLRLRRPILPVFPNSLLARGILQGSARVVIDVDTAGLPTDWLVVGHTQKEFGDAAVSAVRQWHFDPMMIEGHPVASQVAVAFNFEAKGVVLDITAASDVTRFWFSGSLDKVYRPCTLSEIDAIPVPQVWVEPIYPRELEERGVRGSATVEFYIDETGTVRMPAVVRADFPELGHLLADAVRQWRFDPPTRHGEPVLVHARQTVAFGREG